MSGFKGWWQHYVKHPERSFSQINIAEDAFKAGLKTSAEMCKKRADKYCYEEKSPEKASVAYGLQVMIYEDFLEDR